MKKLNLYFIIVCLCGLWIYACSSSDELEDNCTDDGCPEFVSMMEELDAELIAYNTSAKVVPIVSTKTKDDFVYSLNRCITHLYQNVPLEKQIPRELIIAQAAIETGWGKSRFANEGNNLFGIRTFNKDDEWLLPITWDQDKWIGWGVKVFKTKCDSVAYYIRMINEVYAYAEFREVRAKILEYGEIPDGLDLAPTLTKYASRSNYTELVAILIKKNIRGVYEL